MAFNSIRNELLFFLSLNLKVSLLILTKSPTKENKIDHKDNQVESLIFLLYIFA
jgi:hypothetical protein